MKQLTGNFLNIIWIWIQNKQIMKILFFSESLHAGGKERRLVELLKGLSKFEDISMELALTRRDILMFSGIAFLGSVICVFSNWQEEHFLIMYMLYISIYKVYLYREKPARNPIFYNYPHKLDRVLRCKMMKTILTI